MCTVGVVNLFHVGQKLNITQFICASVWATDISALGTCLSKQYPHWLQCSETHLHYIMFILRIHVFCVFKFGQWSVTEKNHFCTRAYKGNYMVQQRFFASYLIHCSGERRKSGSNYYRICNLLHRNEKKRF